jgi:hypothetical protein
LETVLVVGPVAEGLVVGPAAAAVGLHNLPIDHDKIGTVLRRSNNNFWHKAPSYSNKCESYFRLALAISDRVSTARTKLGIGRQSSPTVCTEARLVFSTYRRRRWTG